MCYRTRLIAALLPFFRNIISMGFFKKISDFFGKDLWQINTDELPWWKRALVNAAKVIILTTKAFIAKKHIRTAAALTYSTLLAIVPIAAVIFAVARGFDYSKYIEEWFKDALASQPQVADAIIGFVNSYLVHARSGIILGVGLIFMLWTVIMLTSNIEEAFNDIWLVKKTRPWSRTIIDYTAVFFLLPVVILVTSGVSIVFATISDRLKEVLLVAPIMKFLVALVPYVIWSLVFMGLYVYMPNTKVKWTKAVIPGIIAGVAMQLLQLFYIHSQIWVSSYNAIYGSFAALPLFMLWLQISWTICLFGAEMCYVSQNLKDNIFDHDTSQISHQNQTLMAAMLLSVICKRHYKGQSAFTARQLQQTSGLPLQVTLELLERMKKAGIINCRGGAKGENAIYQPSMGTNNISLGLLVDKLERQGEWKPKLNTSDFDSKLWRKIFKIRKDYTKDLHAILIRDL